MEIKLLSGALGAEIKGIDLKDTSDENIKKHTENHHGASSTQVNEIQTSVEEVNSEVEDMEISSVQPITILQDILAPKVIFGAKSAFWREKTGNGLQKR